jgi:pimeloyl-ACP methyl ester carboxylesterase
METSFLVPPGKHGIAELDPGVRLHYVVTGSGDRTIVLLHGYPQTWWEWRHVLTPLVRAGWRVITPDYRGAGGSSKPPTGYDKRTMAADIYKLLREHLHVSGPVTMVGHDIGMMVAYAFASEYPKAVNNLVLMEAPLPGTLAYDAAVASTKLDQFQMWHFFFHNAQDNLAEALTAGRERLYLQHFYERFAFNQDAITRVDLDLYASHYSAAGAMRAGFEVYRAFDQDAADNKAALKKNGSLTMPVLALGGTSSFFLPMAKAMLAEVARHVTVVAIPEAGHWIAEENPKALVDELIKFCK